MSSAVVLPRDQAPSMIYRSGARDLDPEVVGDQPLATVHETTVWLDRAGDLVVYVRGRMLRKDGGAGPSRASRVDLAAAQPAWLAAVIADARARYGLCRSTGAGTSSEGDTHG